IWVAVNEADIGKLKPGQPVTFTVDAFPNETFQGEVGKIRLNAAMTQNVVTYTVEVTTDNSSGRLLPYLTANVRFGLDRLNDVLMAPNAALRWLPTTEQVAPEYRQNLQNPEGLKDDSAGESKSTGGKSENRKLEAGKTKSDGEGTNRGLVWVAQGRYVRPIFVRVGPTDGILTEIKGRNLTEGLDVVTGIETVAAAASGTTNPFAPKLPARPQGSQGGGPRR
ncbi:MAG: efflux RND transporter periplasmic adaptor subunit, partial [Deltaproteobacteria bacterium]|nr:efflux RND transporter periplasmic adaptor subunit [Deltaproteobacteria bacterium]